MPKATFMVGDPVVQIMPGAIRGKIIDITLDKTTTEHLFLVEGQTDDGKTHQRYFREDELERDT